MEEKSAIVDDSSAQFLDARHFFISFSFQTSDIVCFLLLHNSFYYYFFYPLVMFTRVISSIGLMFLEERQVIKIVASFYLISNGLWSMLFMRKLLRMNKTSRHLYQILDCKNPKWKWTFKLKFYSLVFLLILMGFLLEMNLCPWPMISLFNS